MVATGVVRPSESGAKTKVGKFDVTATVNEHVVWFDVSVYETHLVDTVDCHNQLSDEELRQALVENSQLDQQPHEITTRYVLHHEVEVCGVLKSPAIKLSQSVCICIYFFFWNFDKQLRC